jgi:hypothetical protein
MPRRGAQAEAMGLITMMLEEHGMMNHVDMGCVAHNVHAIVDAHGTNGELNFEQFEKAVHEAEDPVGPCFHS